MNLAYSDYHIIPRAFEGDGIRVDSLDKWQDAIRAAKESRQKNIPFIINAIIGKTDFRKGSISV